MKPSVSIIIPSLNSSKVSQTIDSLCSQSLVLHIAEILVIGLDARRSVREHKSIQFIDTGLPVTAPVARNIGIRRARGQYLAFIDSDCIAAATWLERLLERHQAGHMIVGGGISFPSSPYLQLCYNLTMFHEFLVSTPAGPRANMGTLNLSIHRDVVANIGLMDERLDRGQDTEWTLRMRQAGYTLFFAPDAVVTHLPEVPSVQKIITTWWKSGMYNAWVRRQYPDLIGRAPFDGSPLLQRVMAPVIAGVVTARIFARNIGLLRYFHTAPLLFATKVAWCWGASRSSRLGEG
jgi:glycosyltransferase involved in cell wall biosynthesis